MVLQPMEGGVAMLTSIHYFGQYRDFVLRTTQGRNNNFNASLYDRGQAKRAVATLARTDEVAPSAGVQLNKAYNNKVLQYIRALGDNVVAMKDASRLFVLDSGNLDFTAGGSIGFENHLRWIDEDLRNFSVSYNNLNYLSQGTRHNPLLSDFAHSVRNIAKGHEVLLSHLGVITADAGGISYHGIGTTATKEITKNAAEAFKATYEASRNFLKHPMTTHLEFRDLNYYYSYTIGNTPADSFKLIESGILIDRII